MLWGASSGTTSWSIRRRSRELSGLRQIWFSPGAIEAEGHYWPLVYTPSGWSTGCGAPPPAGYHVVNVLLHLANTLLLWQLLRRLALPGAWLVAAVFAVHPLHVESVAWVIERKDVLSGLFYLAAAAVWIRFADEPRPAPGRYLAALALYAAGMLSKSVVVTLPVALLILIWWQRGSVAWIDLRRLAPFFLVGLAISVGDLIFNRSQAVARFDYSVIERGLIAARALWFYVGKTWWPLDLASSTHTGKCESTTRWRGPVWWRSSGWSRRCGCCATGSGAGHWPASCTSASPCRRPSVSWTTTSCCSRSSPTAFNTWPASA